MEFQKNEMIEGQKKALVDRETVHQKEKEAFLRELDQLRNQLAQVTTAYNATRADLDRMTAERDALRHLVSECRNGAAQQEKQAKEKVALLEERSALQAVGLANFRRYAQEAEERGRNLALTSSPVGSALAD
eukprot:11159686-Lingulodinium_polyedra.AAC.1